MGYICVCNGARFDNRNKPFHHNDVTAQIEHDWCNIDSVPQRRYPVVDVDQFEQEISFTSQLAPDAIDKQHIWTWKKSGDIQASKH